jgi:hypothetical protein
MSIARTPGNAASATAREEQITAAVRAFGSLLGKYRNELWIKAPECARLLKLSTSTIYVLCEEQKLHAHTIPGREREGVNITVRSVALYLAESAQYEAEALIARTCALLGLLDDQQLAQVFIHLQKQRRI